jgi:hypothetical protein
MRITSFKGSLTTIRSQGRPTFQSNFVLAARRKPTGNGITIQIDFGQKIIGLEFNESRYVLIKFLLKLILSCA